MGQPGAFERNEGRPPAGDIILAFCYIFHMADPTAAAHSFLDYLSKFSPLLWLALGGLVTQLWIRFRTRTRRFVWKAWHQPIAMAANHPQLGTVTVQYNGVPVSHVHATTVEITNDSNEDQKDVVLTISFQGVGHIINSAGYVEGCLGAIPFDPAYTALYVDATPAQVDILNTYVVHKIPVLNRWQKATFNLLVRDDVASPVAQVSCNHPGFKLEYGPTGLQIDGVPLQLATGTGFLVTAATVSVLLLYLRHRHAYSTALIAWLVGVFSGRLGAATVKSLKALLRVLG